MAGAQGIRHSQVEAVADVAVALRFGALMVPGSWSPARRRDQNLRRAHASDFEKRHQERFKGVIFDWKDFQRDGAPFPAPDPTAGNAVQITVRPAAGGESKVLVDLDIRPANIAWHPDGKTIAFTADTDWRNELKYASPDLWTVTVDGKVTQLTNDGYSYSDVAYSPDGKYLAYARTFGTDMVIQQKLNHGGPRDLFLRPVTEGLPDQHHRELGPRAGRQPLEPRQQVPVFHRHHRRRGPSVPCRRRRPETPHGCSKSPPAREDSTASPTTRR